jgi:branched-chain amino acid transport system substrate-binding protein
MSAIVTLLPAMPLVVERRRFFVELMGLGVNREFAYPGYFAMIPAGPDPNTALMRKGSSPSLRAQSPRPTTVPLVTTDAEFAGNPLIGGRANAERYGFTIGHDRPIRRRRKTSRRSSMRSQQPAATLLFFCSQWVMTQTATFTPSA